jgi:hypothetical protein
MILDTIKTFGPRTQAGRTTGPGCTAAARTERCRTGRVEAIAAHQVHGSAPFEQDAGAQSNRGEPAVGSTVNPRLGTVCTSAGSRVMASTGSKVARGSKAQESA